MRLLDDQMLSFMGAEQIKKILHLRIEQASESFLRILYAMTEAYANEHLGSEPSDKEIETLLANMDIQPMTREELIKEIELANAQIEKGKYITLDDLEKEMEQW